MESVLEAAKFLRELEQQAMDNVISKVITKASNNEIGFSAMHLHSITSYVNRRYFVKLKINGNELQVHGEFKDSYNAREVYAAIYKSIMDKTGEIVAAMLDQTFENIKTLQSGNKV